MLEWRLAGVEEAARRPWLPFFIEWVDPVRFPGAAGAPIATVARLELEADVEELSSWLGDHSLPLYVRPGESGVAALVLDGPRGRVRLGRTSL